MYRKLQKQFQTFDIFQARKYLYDVIIFLFFFVTVGVLWLWFLFGGSYLGYMRRACSMSPEACDYQSKYQITVSETKFYYKD